ncbi:hypothetical protein [Streptomyces spirodelae]|uniref:SWIM-type domain-containing protein n=1 Tax=Streptomyces spirodelae TaxID=2812904 RepID=A0ABS3X2X0_9ACTN|nr:hypothetical protein [Streptomyces spirodelae]MBO8189720.1 hypothetical protein [Streptomyces spirodelae]
MTDTFTDLARPSTAAGGTPDAEVRLTVLRKLAATTRAEIEVERAQQRAEQEQLERETVCSEAHEHLQAVFPATLARVVAQDAWTGYPALHRRSGPVSLPCAAAYLGEGVWLYFELLPTSGGLLKLLAPCPCGQYTEQEPCDDYQLAGQLDELPGVTGCPGHTARLRPVEHLGRLPQAVP